MYCAAYAVPQNTRQFYSSFCLFKSAPPHQGSHTQAPNLSPLPYTRHSLMMAKANISWTYLVSLLTVGIYSVSLLMYLVSDQMAHAVPAPTPAVGVHYDFDFRAPPYKAVQGRVYDVAVIGAGVGGLSAGIYAARAGLDVVVIADGNGELAMSELVANFPGVDPASGIDLLARMSRQATAFGASKMDGRVGKLQVSTWPYNLSISQGREVNAWSVILASGASLRWPDIKNENLFCGKSLHTCPLCDGNLYVNKTVAVIGGGNSAVESAVYLARLCRTVVLIHRRSTFRAAKRITASLAAFPNIVLKMPYTGLEWVPHNITAEVPTLKSILLRHVETGKVEEIALDGAFVAIGSVPVTGYLGKDFAFTPSGHVKANSAAETNVAGVYAAGEVADFKYKQAVTAAAAGAIAATESERWLLGKTEFLTRRRTVLPPVPPVVRVEEKQVSHEDALHEIECKEVALACIKKFISEHQVVVFSKTYCPYCVRAKQVLENLHIDDVKVVELDLSPRGAEVQKLLAAYSGRRTVPNIFVRGKNIGGSEELEKERDLLELLLRKKG